MNNPFSVLPFPPRPLPQNITASKAFNGLDTFIVVAIDDQTGRKFLFLDEAGCKNFEDTLRATRLGLATSNHIPTVKDGK